jgi:hypothetical protein
MADLARIDDRHTPVAPWRHARSWAIGRISAAEMLP